MCFHYLLETTKAPAKRFDNKKRAAMEFLLQNQNPNQKPDPIWWGQKPDPDPDHLLKNGTSSGYSMVPSQT